MIQLIEHSNYLEIVGLPNRTISVSVPYNKAQFNTEENSTFSIVSTETEHGYYYNIGKYDNVIGYTSFGQLYDYLDGLFKGAGTVNLSDSSGTPISSENPLHVTNGSNELSSDAWGRPKSITDKTLFSGMFTANVPVSIWKEHFNDVERVPTNATSLNGKLSVLAGNNFQDVTKLSTFRHLRYQSNRGHLYSTAGYIVNPTSSMIRDFGSFTDESGVFFRVKSDGLYAVVATTVNDVYQEDERVIYTTAQLLTEGIDLSKGHTYDIQFEWRGVGDYFFYLDLKKVKSFNYIGTRTELTMFNPSNPVSFRSINFGGNDPMQFGCVDITSEGGEDPKGQYGSVSLTNESGQVTISGYNQPIIAIRSKLLFEGKTNTRDTLALLASAYSDTKSMLRVWSTRDFSAITPNDQTWSNFGDGHLEYIVYDQPDVTIPMTFDTTKAQPVVFGSRVGQDATYATSALFEGRTNVHLTSGDMFIFTVHRENGGTANVGVTFEFAEEI